MMFLMQPIVTFLLVSSLFKMNAQAIVNNGSKIFLNGGVFVRVDNILIKNYDVGTILVCESSRLNVNVAFENTSGNVSVTEKSTFYLKEDMNNKSNFNNIQQIQTSVKQNVLNEGIVNNEGIIEIGE